MLKSERLNRILQQIVTIADPEKIVLFGSAARKSRARDVGDLDLCLVLRDDVNATWLRHKLYNEVDRHGFPMDLVTTSVSEFSRPADLATVLHEIQRNGITVYDKNRAAG